MNLRNTVICAAASFLFAGAAIAQEAEKAIVEKEERPIWRPALEVSFDHSSRYMSEGFVGNPDEIDTISVNAEFGISDNLSFHIGGVAIFDETDACGNNCDVEEWDWLAGVTFKTPEIPALGALEINLDYIYYNYPRDKTHKHFTDTKEYELDVNAVDVFLAPGFAFVHDFENDVIKGNLNVTYEQPLKAISEKLSIECPVELWFGNHQYTGTTSTTAYSLCVQPTLNYAICDNLTIGTYLLMAWALNENVRREWKEDENNNKFNMCWGVKLTAEF